MAQELLTQEEAGIRLRAKPTTLQWWRTTGRGPKYVKLGRKVFYRMRDLDAFIAAGEREPVTAA